MCEFIASGWCSDAAGFATQIICAPIDLSSDVVEQCGDGGRGRTGSVQHVLYIGTRQRATPSEHGRLRRQFFFITHPKASPAWILWKLCQSRRLYRDEGDGMSTHTTLPRSIWSPQEHPSVEMYKP
ncbi:unnamed protein product [Arctia plantaginis]|uniref:Uncharacterized protein n=1 Tax=Arctia plantaginis TaxID=874455 RepID=A0A8S1AWU3_ARCPL|nr:unnamed protein product [Arctia plantaginis]